jgi:hypothetical protein
MRHPLDAVTLTPELDAFRARLRFCDPVCGIAPGAPIGGCDPPQPASIATATQLVSEKRPTSESYVAQPPYSSSSSSFNSVTYPDATSTYMYAISDDTKIKVGYVLGPNYQGQHTRWGAVDYRGLWSLVNRHGDENDCKTTENSHPPVHELLGFDNPSPHEVAVGFYTSAHYGCSPRRSLQMIS